MSEREESIKKQLTHLLFMPKASDKIVMGVYGDRRMGLGVAVLDASGRVLDEAILFSPGFHMQLHEAVTQIARFVSHHQVQCIALGHGGGLPQARHVLRVLKQRYPDMPITYTVVDEMGLLRNSRAVAGAVSIAKRLQNPLLQLLSVPVEQMQLSEADDKPNSKQLVSFVKAAITEAVVNMGVDVNTAPAALLRYVPGLENTLARAIVRYRDAHGAFDTQGALKQVPGMEDTAFDSLSVSWTDPRPAFKVPQFGGALTTLQALKVGDVLEGVVCRVVSFGVFIDVGLPQLGLLHISLYKKPLYVGDVVRVAVKQVDSMKHQMALRLHDAKQVEMSKKKRKNKNMRASATQAPFNTAMADALVKLKRGTS